MQDLSQNPSQNKMGTMPIPKVLLNMGIPIILSMVLQACYNIVDSIFVARMSDYGGILHAGEYAVNALTLAFPIQMLIVALGIGTGVGVNALMANQLGQNNRKGVAQTAGNGISLGIFIFILFFAFGLFGIDVYLKTQTSNPIILKMGHDYLKVCCLMSFGICLYTIFEKLLQATGKTVYSTIGQIAGALTNIILDPIMIYGLLGFPRLNVTGAALATVIGQIVSMAIAMGFHCSKNKEVPNGAAYLKLHKDTLKKIYVIGLPAIIMQALMSFMTYGINIIFGLVSEQAVTAYGIFYKIQQFLFFAAFGLRDAITPLIAFNHGRRNRRRVQSGIRYGLLDTEVIMLAGTIVLELFGEPLVSIFGLTSQTAALCVLAVRIISIGFLFAGINIAGQGIFQALECGWSSLVISLLRLCVVVLPLAYWFTTFAHATKMIWMAFPIAEGVTLIFTIILLKRTYRRLVLTIPLPNNTI
ncbi:MATE family efflux transporter [Pseudoramibacter faecis]|uniref:MATE family efflux transporter n=1 Tax=Pseudoramibacter faecis TaxID=3108534 RepID=UPI002E77B62F|nr:MATE family efflux transporter [Pseudoramibacter sp. HA2172]